MGFSKFGRVEILFQELKGRMEGKVKDLNLHFLREEEIMKDGMRKRDVIKLEDDVNSTKEANDIRG